MEGIHHEVMVFLVALVSGAIVRLTYRLLSCFRTLIKHSLVAVGIEDFLFWVISALYLFVQIYHTSTGSVRWNFVLGVALGAIFVSIVIHKIEKLYKKMYAKNSKKSEQALAKDIKKR